MIIIYYDRKTSQEIIAYCIYKLILYFVCALDGVICIDFFANNHLILQFLNLELVVVVTPAIGRIGKYFCSISVGAHYDSGQPECLRR